jgi:fructose-1,6-bisphosphatase-3
VGGIYKIYNGNLLFHGCVPLEEDGSLMKLTAANGLSGRELMDFCDRAAREGYFSKRGSKKRQFGEDFLWYLGVGKNSPLLGKEKMATFERSLLTDEIPKKEKKNAYFNLWDKRETAEKILAEFGLFGEGSHIVNGHIPQNRGGHPIKAGGKLIVIDGGFCSAYHGEDDIAGYTLIYNAEGMRLCAHAPFKGREDAIKNNGDILSDTVIFETKAQKLRIRETDLGREIREEMYELMMLLKAYESGKIPERG